MGDNLHIDASDRGGTARALDKASGVKTLVATLDVGGAGNEALISALNPLPTQLYVPQDSGLLIPLHADTQGHLEMAIHSPRLPYGSVHAEGQRAEFQTDATYGINTCQVVTEAQDGASVTVEDNMFKCSLGTTANAFAELQSRKRMRNVPGQGVEGKFAGKWSAPVANSKLLAGFANTECGVFIGDVGTQFGILHITDGVREIQTLTVTTKSTTAENITVTLDGTAFNVPVTDATESDTKLTAYEIATFASYVGFKAEQIGDTVVFLANQVGDKVGAFSIAGTTVVGSFAETLTGVTTTPDFIPQSSWNGDKMNGSGASGVTLNPLKGNTFKIGIQHGFGAITISVEIIRNGNNADFVDVHTIKANNNRDTPNFSNPGFPFCMLAKSEGSTTDGSISISQFSGHIEGEKAFQGNSFAYDATKGSITTTELAVFTVRNALVYKGRANQSVVYLRAGGGAVDHNKPMKVSIIRNATLGGTPNFQPFDVNSCTLFDTAATTVSAAAPNQRMSSDNAPTAGNVDLKLARDEFELQPGESATVSGVAITGTGAAASLELNTKEDQ